MSPRTLAIRENILGANSRQADSNRKRLDGSRAVMLNVLSSPGSGKTSLILRAIDRLKARAGIAVIEGDVASSIDADRVRLAGVPAVQINTGGGCHLDALMVGKALDELDLGHIDLIFVENVGNLVCTADFDLGAHKNVAVLSVPEGDDKPFKYPVVFAGADAVVVNKIDVAPYFDFKLDGFPRIIGGMNPAAKVFAVSARTGEGLDGWFSWIEETLKQRSGI